MCHLKGKFNGVLAAATGIDGNNSIFPVAYSVLEYENTSSWTWFLESLKKAIGTLDGLVISSDMQKGLEHERLLKEIASVNEDAVKYLTINHNKLWSRSKFGTTCKCDYMTNNISEAFNSWVGTFRYQPVLDLLDNIREKILKRLDKKRRIVRKWNGTLNLGEYEVCRSNDNHAEVKCNGKRWQVVLDERICSCRVWQVKGLPCVHASAFISFTRDSWEKYCDLYFTIEKFKDAYAFGVATMPGKDQWVRLETGEKIYPPIIKRPAGRPRKNRIVPADETKKRHRCKQCGQLGHRQKSCKNPPAQSSELGETSSTKRSRRKKAKGHESSAAELGSK
ncbi:transposase, MuDR [Tanacetum coccineum]